MSSVLTLGERVRTRKSETVAGWRKLVRKVADGAELTAKETDLLIELAEDLDIENIEEAFNGDVQTLRNIAATELQIAGFNAADSQTQREKLAADIRRIEREQLPELRRQLAVLNGTARCHHDTVAELDRTRVSNPRLFDLEGGAL